MTTEYSMGSQLKLLLSGVSDHGTRHLAEVESDLAQTRFLLEQAIAKLGASFLAIYDATRAQQGMVDALISVAALAPESRAGLEQAADEIGRQVNAAVTGLQFQDLTSQLLDRTGKRIAGLQRMLAALGSGGSSIEPDNGGERSIALLANLNRALALQNEELDAVLRKSVRQMHMESGDIELF